MLFRSQVETIEEGCRGHGFSEEDIDNLIEDLNEVIATMPARPQTLTLTKDAAMAIRQVAVEEHPAADAIGLSVQAEKDGSFFLEFRDAPEDGDKIFRNADIDDVALYASPLTLQRIGGATIDMREGRFKLDLGSVECCGEKRDGCGCGEKVGEVD